MASPMNETRLHLKRRFAAPREKVFKAWTEPAQLNQWFRVGDDWSTPIADVELKVGGKYRLGMQEPASDAPYVVHGTFKEIASPEKLVYTWQWEGQDASETLVTVLFHDLGEETEIELIHERFANSEERDKHNHGWLGCLEQLQNLLLA